MNILDIKGGREYRFLIDKELTAQVQFMYSCLAEENKHTPKCEIVGVKSAGSCHGLAFPNMTVVIAKEAKKREDGQAWNRTFGWVRVPPRPGYLLYVLCHELAHIRRFQAGDFHTGHEKLFQEELKLLCPPDLQHWEYEYKPDEALQAGVNHIPSFAVNRGD